MRITFLLFAAALLGSVVLSGAPLEVRGSLSLPDDWRIYGPVSADWQPDTAQMPLDGGVSVRRNNTLIDFEPVIGEVSGSYGWAFCEFEAQAEQLVTIGAGADWWMQLYCNGEKLVDTMESGNRFVPVTIDNYMIDVKLKAGKNLLAVKFRRGDASAHLFIGGPDELRANRRRISMRKILWIEDFDSTEVRCTGTPENVTGTPAPGILTPTGLGKFSSGVIRPQDYAAPLPVPGEFTAVSLRLHELSGTLKIRLDEEHQALIAAQEGKLDFSINGIAVGEVNASSLPAEFILAAERVGRTALSVRSLIDSRVQCFWTAAAPLVQPPQAEAEVEGTAVIDNFTLGIAEDSTGYSSVPFKIERDAEFDPVKAGWKQVFSDEFEGESLDLEQWNLSYDTKLKNLVLKDGKLIGWTDWNEEHTNVDSVMINSRRTFLYGYFEARVKCCLQPGWFSAFWLCVPSPSNNFIDGFEIDVYEDYYLRPKTPGGPPGDVLDHTMHTFVADKLKSWNYTSKMSRGPHDFYRFGVKWTPFELSYYIDGKLIRSSASHSPYDGVTFDAFNHAACIKPLHVIFSGLSGHAGGGDPKNGIFPDQFEVDYVRVYEYPQDPPQISVQTEGMDDLLVPLGSTVRVTAEVTPAANSGAPITGVYLMDSGFVLDYRTDPPYEFEFPLTQGYYSLGGYLNPGRQNQHMTVEPSVHVFSVMAQDANGEVAFSEPWLRYFSDERMLKSTPYQGKAAALPGIIHLEYYDEGGQFTAYYDRDEKNWFSLDGSFRPGEMVDARPGQVPSFTIGEWLNYTVDVAESAEYQATLRYTLAYECERGVVMFIDGKEAAEFPLQLGTKDGEEWNASTLSGLKLTAGRHIITLMNLGKPADITTLEFVK